MTIHGWDASHHDWVRGPMNIAAAVDAGVSFMTHKVGEASTVVDDWFDDFYRRARAAGVPLLGAYYVNHPGDQIAQADRFLALLDSKAPGWRDGPFILQVDAERFDYMTRAPNFAEIHGFCDRLVAKTSARYRPIVYAPRWLYGDSLRGLGYPLWASDYGANPISGYRSVYPGDGSSRWVAYSGQVPAILQYGSRTKIGTQPTCDANAFRGTLEQLCALVSPAITSQEKDMQQTETLIAKTDNPRRTVGDVLGDLANLRNALISAPGLTLADRPVVPGGSMLDKMTSMAVGFPALAAQVTALAADVAALKAQPTVQLDYDQLAAALLRHIATPQT